MHLFPSKGHILFNVVQFAAMPVTPPLKFLATGLRSVIVFFLLTLAVRWTALLIIFKLIEGVLCCVTCSRSNKKRYISDKDHYIAGQRDNQDVSAVQMMDLDQSRIH